ncbi:MAG: hypothetical protein KDK26_17635 [Roseivivax sp.]|nr:hypothetical protein [Roseivivax sp.]
MTTQTAPLSTAQSHDAAVTGERSAYLLLAIVLALVIAAVATWGVVGLAMSALATVPVIYVVLLLLTVGK